ncbi:NUDIX hydrolase [Brevibacillus daliensis]|uniref:NUDIX hydrolase n=1 Tax=Brevibacillus daliensis TaxID=2892995 RepID=UPI001E28BE00|nr:NUDIX hydrolase [Brevibacillus daliensis]
MKYIEQINHFIPEHEQDANDKRLILDYIKQFPHNILLRENELAHITSSGLIVNEQFDKVLMVHHNIYNTWAWTGGHADGDTDLLYVAVKEAKEETGVEEVRALSEDIISIDILPVLGHMKRGKYVSAHLHLNVSYLLLADESSTLTINEAENSGVKWLEIDKLNQYSNEPYMVAVYEKIIERGRRLYR